MPKKTKIITPKKVNRVDSKNIKSGRHYSPDGKPDVKYPSVTTVISKFHYNPMLKRWKENVGKEEAAKISLSASSLGTKVHKLNELYFASNKEELQEYNQKLGEYDEQVIERHDFFRPLLKNIDPIFTEQAMVWEDISPMNPSQTYGFGGTADLVAKILDPTQFYEDKACTIPYTGFSKKGELFILGDYKNWKSPKYASSLSHTNLQLAAYTWMVNRNTNYLYDIQDALILGSAPQGLYIYHLGQRELKWYRDWFAQIVRNYYEFTDPGTLTFDWRTFESYSIGKKRVMDSETKEWKTQLLEENFLCRRIYVKNNELANDGTDPELSSETVSD